MAASSRPNSVGDVPVGASHFSFLGAVKKDAKSSGDEYGDGSRTFDHRSAKILAVQKSWKVPEEATDGTIVQCFKLQCFVHTSLLPLQWFAALFSLTHFI